MTPRHPEDVFFYSFFTSAALRISQPRAASAGPCRTISFPAARLSRFRAASDSDVRFLCLSAMVGTRKIPGISPCGHRQGVGPVGGPTPGGRPRGNARNPRSAGRLRRSANVPSAIRGNVLARDFCGLRANGLDSPARAAYIILSLHSPPMKSKRSGCRSSRSRSSLIAPP